MLYRYMYGDPPDPVVRTHLQQHYFIIRGNSNVIFQANVSKQWTDNLVFEKVTMEQPPLTPAPLQPLFFALFTQHSPASTLSSPVKWLSSEYKALMRKHTKGTRLVFAALHRDTVQTQIPPAIQTRSFSYDLLLPAVWLAWQWGQLLILLPLHFLLGLPAASPLFSTAPWKGGWNKCYQPSRRQTAPFCLWLLLYRRAFTAQRKPASVETTMASQRTSPSPLLLTHTLHAAGSTYAGVYNGWPRAQW